MGKQEGGDVMGEYISSRRIRGPGLVACTGDTRNTHKILVGKTEGNKIAWDIQT
jgi:hypothetical protein